MIRSSDEFFGAFDNVATSLQRAEETAWRKHSDCLPLMCLQVKQICIYSTWINREFMHREYMWCSFNQWRHLYWKVSQCCGLHLCAHIQQVLTGFHTLSGVFHVFPLAWGVWHRSAEECFKWTTCIFWTNMIHYSDSHCSLSAALLGIKWERLH